MPTALITGASSGIGAEFARQLAKDGHDLILVARRLDRLETLATEVSSAHGVKAVAMSADLGKPGAAAELAARVAEQGLVVDVLVNNAGFGHHGLFVDVPLERQRAMIDLNVTALVELAHAFVPGMVERGKGGVLNVASTAAFQPIPYMAVYAATKAFVLSFSEALAEEVGPRGVKVTCLCPGPTETEFVEQAQFKTDMTEKAPMMTAAAVAAEGLAALRTGRAVQVPGMLNALTAISPRFFPRSMVTKVTGMIFKPNR